MSCQSEEFDKNVGGRSLLFNSVITCHVLGDIHHLEESGIFSHLKTVNGQLNEKKFVHQTVPVVSTAYLPYSNTI